MQLSLDAVRSTLPVRAAIGIEMCSYAMAQSYKRIYGTPLSGDVAFINAIASEILPIIARTDARYHNLAHTITVISAGHQILEGKHRLEGGVDPQDWLNATVALMVHDLGYVKGACRSDDLCNSRYAVGDGAMVILSEETTDASLAPYHVGRGQLAVEERLGGSGAINIDAVKAAVEFTRFPVPSSEAYQNTQGYPGLVRAADLIGQLADPNYLSKLPDLFAELYETGAAQKMGYRRPEDLRNAYPGFYRRMVYPHIQAGILYLSVTPQGQQTIASLYQNLAISETTHPLAIARRDFRQLTIDEYGQIS